MERFIGFHPTIVSKHKVLFFQEHVDENGTFVIGDGRYYNTSDKSYYNKPLKTGETYRIGMAALSKLSDNNLGLSFRAVKDPITVQAPNGKQVFLPH